MSLDFVSQWRSRSRIANRSVNFLNVVKYKYRNYGQRRNTLNSKCLPDHRDVFYLAASIVQRRTLKLIGLLGQLSINREYRCVECRGGRRIRTRGDHACSHDGG